MTVVDNEEYEECKWKDECEIYCCGCECAFCEKWEVETAEDEEEKTE